MGDALGFGEDLPALQSQLRLLRREPVEERDTQLRYEVGDRIP